jgi:hypothetical protein
MNIHTQDIARILKCDLSHARNVQLLMERAAFDFSECTQREFNNAVRAAAKRVPASIAPKRARVTPRISRETATTLFLEKIVQEYGNGDRTAKGIRNALTRAIPSLNGPAKQIAEQFIATLKGI